MVYPIRAKIELRDDDGKLIGDPLGVSITEDMHMHQIDRLFKMLINSVKVILRDAKTKNT
jgi:hypothetical protein